MPGIRGAIGNGRSCLRSPGNFGGDGTRAWLNRASGLGRWFGASLPTTPCPKHARSFGIPTLCRRTLAKRPAPAQPERPDDMGIGGQAGGTLAPQAPDIPSLAVSTLPRQTPEVGAVCGNSARTVLCGGRSAMSVPCTRLKLLQMDLPPVLTLYSLLGLVGTYQDSEGRVGSLSRPGTVPTAHRVARSRHRISGDNMKLREFAVLAVILSGCSPPIWDNPNATQADYNRDSYECERDARQSGYFGTGLAGGLNMRRFIQECMIARGYTIRSDTESSASAATSPAPPPSFSGGPMGRHA